MKTLMLRSLKNNLKINKIILNNNHNNKLYIIKIPTIEKKKIIKVNNLKIFKKLIWFHRHRQYLKIFLNSNNNKNKNKFTI